MENKDDIKGFNEYKTTMRALSDGIGLLKRHAGMLLMVLSPLLVIVSALWAWIVIDGMQLLTMFMLDSTPDSADIWLNAKSLLLPAALLVVFALLLLAQFYSLFRGYVANGFIPQTTLKTCWKPMLDTLRTKTVLVWLWILFTLFCYVALMGVLISVTPYTLVLTIPIAICMALWCSNLMVDFHVNEGSLMRALTRSVRITGRGFTSFIAAACLLGILMAVLGGLVLIPTISSMVIYEQAQMSVAMDNGQDLPGYFIPVFFICGMVSCYLMLVVKGLCISCWSMLYGAVTVRINHRSSKKDQTSELVD